MDLAIFGKGAWGFIKFVLGITVTMLVVLLVFWGMLAWYGQHNCVFQGKKLSLPYSYDIVGGCYFSIDGKWIPSHAIDYYMLSKEKPNEH